MLLNYLNVQCVSTEAHEFPFTNIPRFADSGEKENQSTPLAKTNIIAAGRFFVY